MHGRIGQLLLGHLRFYQLIGLHGLPLPSGDGHPRRRQAKLLYVWALLLLAAFSGMVLMCLFSNDEFLYRGDQLGAFNDAIKYGFAEVAVISIYAETLCHQKHLARFWQLYEILTMTHSRLIPAETLQQQWLQHKRYLITFYGTILVELVLVCLLGFLQVLSRHLLLFWITFQPLVLLVHLRNTQFVLHLELLRQQLLQLERELGLLVEYTGFARIAASFEGFEDYLRRRLRQKQLYYARIYELSNYFTQAFSYSMVTVPLMIYARVAVDCYFLVYVIYNGIDNVDNFLMTTAVLEIPALIYASQSCMQIVPRIAYQLHNIVAKSTELSLQIQNFSLHILHQPLRIDCLGMTILDSRLLTRIACAVCTYVIFTVQLMPKMTTPYL